MVLPLLAIVLSLSSPVRPPSYALLLMSRTSLHGKMIVQVTSARISAPTAAASCAAEHQRIAALEAANALLNATVAEQAVEISELRGRLLGMPACEHLCLLSRSQASAHSIVAPCAGARAAGALWPSGSTGAALAPAESSPVRVKAHGTPTVRCRVEHCGGAASALRVVCNTHKSIMRQGVLPSPCDELRHFAAVLHRLHAAHR